MIDMVKVAARALCECQGLDPDFRSGGSVFAPDVNKIGGGPANWEVMVPAVRAVLQAIEDPSDRMISDGAFQIFQGEHITEIDSYRAKAVWKAMIRRLLKSDQT